MTRASVRFVGLMLLALPWSAAPLQSQRPGWPTAEFLRERYTKREVDIAMRDGIKLHTVIYSPKVTQGPLPILFTRTPYSAGPYGPEGYARFLGPGPDFAGAGTTSSDRTYADGIAPRASSST